jgi:hypothetical protein
MEKRLTFVVLFIKITIRQKSENKMFQKDFLVREIENFSRFAIGMFRKEKLKYKIPRRTSAID